MILSASLLVAALAADVSEKRISNISRKAEVVATCSVGPDCDRKWQRAREWVETNSKFALARDTATLLFTHEGSYTSPDPSFVVILDQPKAGVRSIRFRTWCRNDIACVPGRRTLKALFVQAMRDAD